MLVFGSSLCSYAGCSSRPCHVSHASQTCRQDGVQLHCSAVLHHFSQGVEGQPLPWKLPPHHYKYRPSLCTLHTAHALVCLRPEAGVSSSSGCRRTGSLCMRRKYGESLLSSVKLSRCAVSFAESVRFCRKEERARYGRSSRTRRGIHVLSVGLTNPASMKTKAGSSGPKDTKQIAEGSPSPVERSKRRGSVLRREALGRLRQGNGGPLLDEDGVGVPDDEMQGVPSGETLNSAKRLPPAMSGVSVRLHSMSNNSCRQ